MNGMSQPKPLYAVDAVPFFPFRLRQVEGQWLVSNPFDHREQVLNEAGCRILKLCDGYRTWHEILVALAKQDRLRFVEARVFAEQFVKPLSESAMVWWRDRRMLVQQVPPPVAVLWDLTSRCNLHCQHCVVGARTDNAAQLPLADCFRLIDEMSAFGVQQLILSGGEPLVREDFFSIVEQAVDRGLTVQVATNATLLGRKGAQRLAELGVNMQVSLDAVTPALHDRFRGSEQCWRKTVGAIGKLLQEGVYVSVASVVTRLNIDELPDLYRFVGELGVDCYRIMPFVPYGRGAAAATLEVEPRRMKQLTVRLQQLQDEIGLPLAPMEFECSLRLPNQSLPSRPGQRIGCEGSVAYCTVTAEGEVLPCNYFAGVEAENVMEKSFEWIWYNSRILNYFRSLQTADIHGVCRNCDWLGECRGSCIAANFVHGDIFQSNCHCWRVHP